MYEPTVYGCPECSAEQEVKDWNNFQCEECSESGRVKQCDTCSHLLWVSDDDIMCDSCMNHYMNKD